MGTILTSILDCHEDCSNLTLTLEVLSTMMPNRLDDWILDITIIQLKLFLPFSSQEEEDLALAQALSASEAEYQRQQV